MVEERRGLGGQCAQVSFDGVEDALDFTGADHCVHFGDLLEDLFAVALDQAAGHD